MTKCACSMHPEEMCHESLRKSSHARQCRAVRGQLRNPCAAIDGYDQNYIGRADDDHLSTDAANGNMNDEPENIVEMKQVVVIHIYPPISDRRRDYCAYHDGEEETGHYGWGSTEAEAREDLARLDDEHADYLEWKRQREEEGG